MQHSAMRGSALHPEHARGFRALRAAAAAARPTRCRCTPARSLRVECHAVRFPASLPVLPFTPKEVLPPGSCKVLRLHDSSSYMLLLEELLSSPHQMLVHAAVEPAGKVARLRLGAYEQGGFVFHLATIVKVIDVKQTEAGVLLRVQAEGRVAVKSLEQTQPYLRALVVPVTDTVDLDRLQASMWREICSAVDRLRSLMRDVQNLAAKFKTPETANLQRAMLWVDNPHPLVFSSSSLLLNSRTAAPHLDFSSTTPPSSPLGSFDIYEQIQPSKILANHILPDKEPLSESGSDAEYSAAAASGAEPPGAARMPGASAGGLLSAAVLSGGSVGASIRTQPSLLDLERACRLSLAAIQLLPRATEEEREAIWSQQQAALETQDVLERLQLAQQVMSEARGLLSAKCALLALSSAR